MSNMPKQEREIGKHEYEVTMLPLSKWLELEGLVVRCFGAPLEAMLSAIPAGGGDIGDLQMESIAPAIKSLLDGLKPEDIDSLCTYMGTVLRVKAEDGSFERLDRSKQNLWWPHNMGEMIGVIAFFLEVEFKDFIAGALSLLTKV